MEQTTSIKEPIEFYLTAYDAVRMDITLPSGKMIVLKSGKTYVTEDKDEQDFLSKLKYVGAKKINDAEFRIWATLKFNELPTIFNKSINDPKDVEEFVWSSPFENEVINKLKALGYTVYRKKENK